MSSSVIPFSSCLQSSPAPESFPMSYFLALGGQSIGALASASFNFNWFMLCSQAASVFQKLSPAPFPPISFMVHLGTVIVPVDVSFSLLCVESEVAQSCPILCDPIKRSKSSIHGIFQAKVLEWIAISFSRGSSRPRNQTQISRIAGRIKPGSPALQADALQPEPPGPINLLLCVTMSLYCSSRFSGR